MQRESSSEADVVKSSFTSSYSGCPLSDDSGTVMCDDLSDAPPDISSLLDALEDADRRSSIDTVDDSQSNVEDSLLSSYLQTASDSSWFKIQDTMQQATVPSSGSVGDRAPGVNTVSLHDVESEFEVMTVRRSTSLKTYKTPPGSPHRKKEVRFADALGLDLESVRHFINTNEPPIVPSSAIRHLQLQAPPIQRLLPASSAGLGAGDSSSDDERRRILHACFPQPGMSPNFSARISERRVALHSFRADYDIISGTVCVANIAYEKRVTVRYTFDGWATYQDTAATYIVGSNTGSTDLFRFSFHLPDPSVLPCSFVEFSIMFSVNNGAEVFWDSNFGSNYRVDCYYT